MLLADDMLKSLSEMEKSGNYKRDNDDFNFGEVLKFYSDGSVDKSKYVNEQHKNYSSDDWGGNKYKWKAISHQELLHIYIMK